MPLTDKEKQYLSLATKIVLGYGSTDVAKRIMEEREAFSPYAPLRSHIIFNPTEIWGDALPTLLPTADTSVVQVYQLNPPGAGAQGMWRLASNSTAANPNMSWLATLDAVSPYWGDDQDPRLENWVPAKYGEAWKPRLYEDFDGTGNNGPGAEILASDAVGWVLDPQSGIVTFEIDPTATKTGPFWLQGYRYVGQTLQDVIAGISAGASITVEDSVPTPFTGTNIIRFGSNFAVTNLGGGRVQIALAATTTWPWPYFEELAIVGNGTVGVPKDLSLSNPVAVSGQNERAFVYMNGAKLTYGATNDYVFTSASTLRLMNNSGRMVTMDGMEITIYHE